MKFTRLFMASVLIANMVSSPVMADNANLSDAQKVEIQRIIHDYLVSNPEVLLEVSQALQQKQQQTMQKQAQAGILENVKELFTDKMAVVGNHKGDVTLVEFFDYQCIHCKKMAPILSNLIKNNSNLRIIYKEYPIFGKNSELASRAALAAAMQNKYLAMHEALIIEDKRINEELIDKLAKSIGLDMDKFKTDMASAKINNALDANRQLADKLHLMGTPAFIIASTPKGIFSDAGNKPSFIPGAASQEALQELISKAALEEITKGNKTNS